VTLELKFCSMHLSVFKLNDLRHMGDRFLGYLVRISLFTAACPPLEKSRKGPVSPFVMKGGINMLLIVGEI